MIRRMQLLSPEDRPSAPRLTTLAERIRDALLHDNKVVPAVLATLALVVFAWLVMGAFIGGSPDEEVANQVSLAQDEDERDGGREPEGGEAETPAPGVENRDTDSYSAFKSKDPFRLLKGIASESDKSGDSKSGDSKSDNGKDGSGKAGDTGAGKGKAGDNGDGGTRDGGTRDNRDSTDQPSPGDPNFRGTGQGGTGDLFNSGGELPAP